MADAVTPEEVVVWVDLYHAGALISNLAQEFGRNPGTISGHLKKAGVRLGRPGSAREGHCGSCLEPVSRNGKCRSCLKIYQRDMGLRRRYGITLEQYDKLLAEQGNCCKLCGSDDPKTVYGFGVDHCHSTGRIRGLLCFSCNKALGMLGDTEEALEKAMEYVRGS